MAVNLEKSIRDILECAVNDDLENFVIELPNGKKRGDGFLGEMTYVSLKNKKTGEDHHLVVKKVLPCTTEDTTNFMHASFNNEINFYSKIWPALDNFQKSYPGVEQIDIAPKLYASSLEIRNEKLVMENLRANNYEMHPKMEPLDLKLYKKMFEMYGKFHGLSFAYKHHNPEKYLELSAPLANNWKSLVERGFGHAISAITGRIKEILDRNGEEKIADKFQKYAKDVCRIFIDSTEYTGPNSIIVHGDCWSNNMMFKFNASREVIDIKMFDYQMCYVGTPVFDLLYSLYSGGNKEVMDNLEDLLQIYHRSLCRSLRQFECDPDEIYSYEDLQRELKENCTFGIIMGIMVWSGKSIQDSATIKLNEQFDNASNGLEPDVKKPVMNEHFFEERIMDLLRHLYENDFL